MEEIDEEFVVPQYAVYGIFLPLASLLTFSIGVILYRFTEQLFFASLSLSGFVFLIPTTLIAAVFYLVVADHANPSTPSTPPSSDTIVIPWKSLIVVAFPFLGLIMFGPLGFFLGGLFVLAVFLSAVYESNNSLPHHRQIIDVLVAYPLQGMVPFSMFVEYTGLNETQVRTQLIELIASREISGHLDTRGFQRSNGIQIPEDNSLL